MSLPRLHSGLFVGLFGTFWLLGLSFAVKIPSNSSFFLLLSGVILAHWLFGMLAWHLLLRPLPKSLGQVQSHLLPNPWRKGLAIALALGIFGIGIGTVWDEIWHSRFGIPFGADFYWFPHILMYLGLAISASSAFLSAYLIFYQAQGNLQQRFRQDPTLGWNTIAGLYTFWAVLLDPFWHWYYGVDLTAWSLPHGVLLVMDLLMGLSALAFINTSFKHFSWGFLRFNWRNCFFGLAMLGMLFTFAVVLMVDVYRPMASLVPDSELPKRPLWVMTSMMILFTVLMAVLILYTSRQIGLASFLISLLIGLRYLLDQSLGSPIDGAAALWLMLTPTVAIELLASAIWLHEKRRIHWGAAGLLGGLLANLVNLPLILYAYSFQTMQEIDLSPASIFLIISTNMLFALIAAWLAKTFARTLATVQ